MTRKKPLDLTEDAHQRRVKNMTKRQAEAAAIEPKKYASGASGAHKNPRFLMSGTPAELEAWERAASMDGQNRVEWLRGLANAAARPRRNTDTKKER